MVQVVRYDTHLAPLPVSRTEILSDELHKMKWCCFKPPLCTWFRLIVATQAQGTMPPEWVQTSGPVIRSSVRYLWTTTSAGDELLTPQEQGNQRWQIPRPATCQYLATFTPLKSKKQIVTSFLCSLEFLYY